MAFIPVVTIAVFTIPSGFGETGKLVWFAVAYLLWDTIYTLTDVPAYSMLNTMTDNLSERNLLLSVNRVFSGAGYLLCVVVMPLLIGRSYAFAVIVLSIFSALTMVPLCVFCKERNYDPAKDEGDFSFRQMFTYLRNNKYLLTYYGGYMATDALKTSAATTLFVSFFLFGSELYSILLNLLGMVPGVIAAMLMPTILKKLDKFKVLFWCNIVNIILGFVIYFLGYENQTLFLVLTCIRAVPLCLVGVLAFMFTPDCAEYGEYKSGISAKGITFAIQKFADERGIPVLNHTWGTSPYNGGKVMYEAISRYPNAKTFLGHCIFGEWDYAVKCVNDFDNVYLELTAVPGERSRIEKLVEATSSKKILLGTDLPWFDEYQAVGGVLSAKISDEEKRDILYRNAQKIFGDDK